ncbi:MAG: hypothetical protein QXS19_05820 [Candidatus Methanomethylicia archaeon]
MSCIRDPPVYDSSLKKLVLKDQYCVYSSSLLKCVSNYIDFDTTLKKLKYITNVQTNLNSTCPGYVDYNSSLKKLVKYGGIICTV